MSWWRGLNSQSGPDPCGGPGWRSWESARSPYSDTEVNNYIRLGLCVCVVCVARCPSGVSFAWCSVSAVCLTPSSRPRCSSLEAVSLLIEVIGRTCGLCTRWRAAQDRITVCLRNGSQNESRSRNLWCPRPRRNLHIASGSRSWICQCLTSRRKLSEMSACRIA